MTCCQLVARGKAHRDGSVNRWSPMRHHHVYDAWRTARRSGPTACRESSRGPLKRVTGVAYPARLRRALAADEARRGQPDTSIGTPRLSLHSVSPAAPAVECCASNTTRSLGTSWCGEPRRPRSGSQPSPAYKTRPRQCLTKPPTRGTDQAVPAPILPQDRLTDAVHGRHTHRAQLGLVLGKGWIVQPLSLDVQGNDVAASFSPSSPQ
jgi:hypothetical protein